MTKVTWFEIPVNDLERAAAFYEKLLEITIQVVDLGPLRMGWFPDDKETPGANGSLVENKEFYHPDPSKGPLIYLSCYDVAPILARVPDLGGSVVIEKRMISPDVGFMGVFLDSEGNRIALHSTQ